MPRRHCAQLTPSREGDTAQLKGRLAYRDDQVAIVEDSSGRASIQTSNASDVPPSGSIVEVCCVVRGGRWFADTWTVLTPWLGGDFPASRGAYNHLRGGNRFDYLHQRARALAAIRRFFDQRDFVEVQTPLRVPAPGLEPHLRAFQAGPQRYLITSPEYEMKRLLVGGMERIYSLGPCFRDEERGDHHLPEFCMLEWYEAFSDLDQLMTQTESLVRSVAGALDCEDLLTSEPFRRASVGQLFQENLGIDLHGCVEVNELRKRAEQRGIATDADGGFDHVFSQLWVEHVEPNLGIAPVLVHRYPAPLAALSRIDPEDPSVALRFELYIGGLELANAFDELTDAAEQRRRFEQDQAARSAEGAAVTPLPERFLAALEEGMPPAAGIALGVDRLLMLLLGANTVAETVAFPDLVVD